MFSSKDMMDKSKGKRKREDLEVVQSVLYPFTEPEKKEILKKITILPLGKTSPKSNLVILGDNGGKVNIPVIDEKKIASVKSDIEFDALTEVRDILDKVIGYIRLIMSNPIGAEIDLQGWAKELRACVRIIYLAKVKGRPEPKKPLPEIPCSECRRGHFNERLQKWVPFLVNVVCSNCRHGAAFFPDRFEQK